MSGGCPKGNPRYRNNIPYNKRYIIIVYLLFIYYLTSNIDTNSAYIDYFIYIEEVKINR